MKYSLGRDRLMFNSSHTHCGPVIDPMLAVAYNLEPGQWSVIDSYTRELEDKLVSAIGGRARRSASGASVVWPLGGRFRQEPPHAVWPISPNITACLS